MTDNARKLLLELYAMKNDDDMVYPVKYYSDEKSGKEFEKYLNQLSSYGFVIPHSADDGVIALEITTAGIEACENEPGSRYQDVMNPVPKVLTIEQLETFIRDAIKSSDNKEKKDLEKLLIDMQSLAKGNHVNIGDTFASLFSLTTKSLTLANVVIAFLRNFSF